MKLLWYLLGINGEINKTVLAAAHLSGINKVFRIGGAGYWGFGIWHKSNQ